jgi:protein TonB
MKGKDSLRDQYPRAVEKAVTAALALFLLLFLAYPSMRVIPYRKAKAQEFFQVEDIPETRQREKKLGPPPKRPSVPVEDETGEVPDTITIPPTYIDTLFRPFKRQPPSAPDTFVAYDRVPVLIKLFQPIYPEIASKAGVEGIVVLKIEIDEKGNVVDARVLQSLGAGCDEAATAAAMQCKYKPAMQRDKPVKVWIRYPVRFRLRETKFK